jgi:type IV pilus assembly protein PilE
MKPGMIRLVRGGSLGFTLIELVTAITIVGVLAAIAYPSYVAYIQKSQRSEAKQALASAAQALERYFTEQNTYQTATFGSSGVYPGTSTNGSYTLSIVAQTQTTYSLQAVPAGNNQAGDKCGTFTLNEQGVQGVTGGSLPASSCW